MKTLELKKEFTELDHKTIQKAIFKYLKSLYKGYLNGVCFSSFSQLDNIIGTAYTSTGIYAIYGVCNGVSLFIDAEEKYCLQMFCIGTDGTIYAEYWHQETEDTIYIKIN